MPPTLWWWRFNSPVLRPFPCVVHRYDCTTYTAHLQREAQKQWKRDGKTGKAPKVATPKNCDEPEQESAPAPSSSLASAATESRD